jgi:hypothetical protein
LENEFDYRDEPSDDSHDWPHDIGFFDFIEEIEG